MGNRAVITTHPYNENNTGIYLHWNGGRASVEGFLQACKVLGYRPPASDPYGWAALTYAICLFFKYDGYSIGIDKCANLDTQGDNGVYLLGEDWDIKDRLFFSGKEEINPEKTQKVKDSVIKMVEEVRTLKG